jgi:hypothetical protein
MFSNFVLEKTPSVSPSSVSTTSDKCRVLLVALEELFSPNLELKQN